MFPWKPLLNFEFRLLSALACAAVIPQAVHSQELNENSAEPNQSFAGAAQSAENYESAYESKAFSAPPMGYSAPYGYQGAPSAYSSNSPFSSGNLPSWQNNSSTAASRYTSYSSAPYSAAPYSAAPDSGAQGIVSSRLQPPVLPEGLVLPFQLDTSIDIDKAQAGDYIQGHITQNISAGGAAYLPGGSVVSGTIDKAADKDAGGHYKHAGKLSINFLQVRLPNGRLIRMNGHLIGRIGNYEYRDTTSGANKVMNTAWRSGVGSELSWGAGTSFASLSSGSHAGPGGGSYAGALMGGATGLLETLFYRHGHDSFLHPGTRMELQLDAPLQVPGVMENHERYLPGSGRNTGIF